MAVLGTILRPVSSLRPKYPIQKHCREPSLRLGKTKWLVPFREDVKAMCIPSPSLHSIQLLGGFHADLVGKGFCSRDASKQGLMAPIIGKNHNSEAML